MKDDEDKKPPDDLESILNIPASIEPRDITPPDDAPDDDYEFAREAIRHAMTKGQTAMDELLAIALESGHPRAYEVLAMIMKEVVGSGRELLETKKTDHQIKFIAARKNTPDQITQQNLFVGTTADLGRMLEEAKKAKKDEDV